MKLSSDDKAQGARGKAQGLSTFVLQPSSFGLWDLGFGIFSLLLYSLTLSPSLLPADAGEYQVVGAVMGVAHPPGFALYTLLGWLISRAPFVAPATAINFLSAIFAALTLVLLSRAVRALTGSALAGICAALALGFSTTFWAQATTANVRMFAALAAALALERLVAHRKLGFGIWDLGFIFLALGLGVSHHGSLVFIAAVFGLYALWLDPGVLRRPWPLFLGLLPFLFWLYFPLRAGAFGAPPRIATVGGFLEHVLARGFRGDILQIANLQQLPQRLLVLGNILAFQFTWPVLALAALGALAALRRDRQFAVVLLLALAAHTFVSIAYKSPQTVEYLLPSYLLMAVFIGFAFTEFFRLTPSPLHLVTLSLSTILLIPQFASTLPSYFALARDTSTRDYAASLLAAAPREAVILASWHWSTPLWYLQQVERRRPDVEVQYVYPRTVSLAQDWVSEIEAALPARPVVVTSFFKPEFDALPYRFIPLGPAWQVLAEPLTTPPIGLTGSREFGDWAFLGYHLESSLDPSVPSVDKPLTLLAAWRTSGSPQDINFYVHLVGADGRLYGQMDVSRPASRYISGEVLLDRYEITPYLSAPPGEYTLTAGAYLPDGTRLAEVILTSVTLAHSPPPTSDFGLPTSIPLGSSIFLTSADISPSGPLRPGEAVTVDLHFLAARPIVADYAVKVDLIGPNYAWRVQSDGTPADGAIPTLKWIAGSRIADRRTLTIPADAAAGTAQLVMAVYDAFTQQDLPILDPALAARGPTVPLGAIEIMPP
jgi:hypothetical protein